MLAHGAAVAQVVMAAEQVGEERFALGAAHQTDRQRSQRRQGSLDRRGVVGRHPSHASMADRVIGRGDSFGGQLEVSGPMQGQQQTPTHHVAGLAVGLHPVPGFTHLDREAATTQSRDVGRSSPARRPRRPHGWGDRENSARRPTRGRV